MSGTLPQGWALATLGEVANYGKTIKVEPSEIKPNEWVLELEDIEKDSSKLLQRVFNSDRQSKSAKNRFFKGDALYGKLRPYLNKVLIADTDGVCTTEIIPISAPEGVDSRYLFYSLKRPDFIDYVSSISHGLNMPRLGTQAGKEADFPLAPLNEQKRIADKLDQLLAAVDSCKTRLDTIPGIIKRFRQSVLAAATSGELTADWREDNKNLFDWSEVVLEDVAEGFSYGTSAKSSKEGKIPVLRMGNIQDGNLDWDDLVFTSDSTEITKYALRTGDVLFNRTNSPELVGKTAVYKGEKQAIFAGYLIRVRCSEKLLPDFLNYCLNSPDGKTYCWQVKTDGVSQSNINAKKLAAFPFHLPPVNEQHEIVRRVESLFAVADRLEARYQTARTHVHQLTSSLLAKAFRGELVPQDPNDEPAEKLLERIRSMQTAKPGKRGKAK
ncbi:MAG TPA: restriction endonuclease subunit S [Desulfuromonadales bacterium]|nr:restriction endonuclease subunit S [Desulfuromonadales bacterium]